MSGPKRKKGTPCEFNRVTLQLVLPNCTENRFQLVNLFSHTFFGAARKVTISTVKKVLKICQGHRFEFHAEWKKVRKTNPVERMLTHVREHNATDSIAYVTLLSLLI